MAIMFGIKASNSSGTQLLHFNKSDNGLDLTLTGDLNGQNIQVDFDELDQEDLQDLISILCKYVKSKTVSGIVR